MQAVISRSHRKSLREEKSQVMNIIIQISQEEQTLKKQNKNR
jgi:hypothetical protein